MYVAVPLVAWLPQLELENCAKTLMVYSPASITLYEVRNVTVPLVVDYEFS